MSEQLTVVNYNTFSWDHLDQTSSFHPPTSQDCTTMSSVLLKSWYLEQVSIIHGFILVFSLISSFIHCCGSFKKKEILPFPYSFTVATNNLFFEHQKSAPGKSPAFKPYPVFLLFVVLEPSVLRAFFLLLLGKYLFKGKKDLLEFFCLFYVCLFQSVVLSDGNKAFYGRNYGSGSFLLQHCQI